MPNVSRVKMALMVLFSLSLTLVLGVLLPDSLNLVARLCGFTETTVTHSIVLVYFLFVLICVAMPNLPRGSVKVEGKAVFITGCDSGFGFALAMHLHALGFTVFAGCLQKVKEGTGVRKLESMKSDRMKVVQMNVCSEEEVAETVKCVRKHLQETETSLWALVNNAGVSTFGEVEFTSLETYKQVADVNLWGTIRVTKAFLPLIRRAKGRVVNIASMFGRMSNSSRSPYCVSKYGVEAFSDCLRYEMHRWGVKVSIIEPGNFIAATGILTRDIVMETADKLWKEAPQIVQEDYGRAHFDRHVSVLKSYCNSGLRDVAIVIKDITDAVMSCYPYTRYNPMDAYWWIRLLIMTHLPAAIADRLYIY
ncbi:D-beta-hydroxybutyrate dehydrogenase, mitochondrial isoform X1 [Acipenser oxyrinchus oxyrinchus]|uniref:D-beta-hydroxybutyrate dehydrogenase, mitochondrial isoform X1 n=1 Tax=Acipenser oxyrinchus oxyrinchus TaxID=40147 RepID=A0AAD8DFU2_ACIOX|nr:D-beta-hydroxybutyrate dehydrogenase, mitochondrial isoform X1 [Acipenser oxyrinchus oxyrinchus]